MFTSQTVPSSKYAEAKIELVKAPAKVPAPDTRRFKIFNVLFTSETVAEAYSKSYEHEGQKCYIQSADVRYAMKHGYLVLA